MSDDEPVVVGHDDIAKQQQAVLVQRSGPSPFDISLKNYPYQPWTSLNADLRQWFNYGLNPTTWAAYCVEQQKLRAHNK